MKIRVLDIAYETMADGPGLRTSIYCAGCAHRCPGCHNPQSWDFKGGQEMSVQELLDIIKDDEFANVTFSGGDPLYQVEAFTELARRIKEETGKTIWCYTGFKYEEILSDARLSMILPYLDVLVDGPFIVINAGDQVKEVKNGKLADVAPTILKLMGIEQPAAMTGTPLV